MTDKKGISSASIFNTFDEQLQKKVLSVVHFGARALVTDHQVIIADEPTASVDTETKQAILDAFKILKEENKTLIAETHDQDLLDRYN